MIGPADAGILGELGITLLVRQTPAGRCTI